MNLLNTKISLPKRGAPLTTLIDAARLLGEDVSRLANARREADKAVAPRLAGARRVATPA